MFLGIGQGRDRDQNFSTCWDLLETGFKFYFLLEIVLTLLSYFIQSMILYLPNIISFTVDRFQLWRLLTSFMLPGIGRFAIINVLFDFYLLYMCMPDVQKKNSTAFILLEVPLQVALCNIALTIIGYPLYYFKVVDVISLVGYGMLPVLFYFIWQKVALNPDEPTRFCFFPCLIPMKYIPLCLLALIVLFGSPPIPMMIYCLVGYYQTMVRKQSIFRLPLSVYRKIDSWLPQSVKAQSGYVKVTAVEANLKKACLNRGICQWGNDQVQSNPFNNERQPSYQPSGQSNRKERVEVIGGGVSIGGSNNYRSPQNETNFKDYWRQKNIEENAQDEANRGKNVAQNRQILESDEQFGQQQNLDVSGVSSKALKKTTKQASLL